MNRQILSMSATYDSYNVPDIGIPRVAPIIGIRTDYVSCLVYDEENNLIGEELQETYVEVYDENWVREEEFIYLTTIGNRKYFSIHQDYTMEILEKEFKDFYDDPDTPDIDESLFFELKLESIDSLSKVSEEDFVVKVLKDNLSIRNKYREDSSYLDYLGLYQPPYETFDMVDSPYYRSFIYPEDAIPGLNVDPEPEPKLEN
jgi:hypothetical protein